MASKEETTAAAEVGEAPSEEETNKAVVEVVAEVVVGVGDLLSATRMHLQEAEEPLHEVVAAECGLPRLRTRQSG